MKRAIVCLAAFLLSCAPQADATDVCEQAARHQEECTGDYQTPPICDQDAAAAAEWLLGLSCDQLNQLGAGDGKADGAFCDWFGFGCTEDEDIFSGPACDIDADCGIGFCAENHCFAGVDSAEFAAVLDQLTGSREVGGNTTQLLIDNSDTFALRRMLIESAEHSIHITSFLIDDDELGYETTRLLADAAARGVEVRVIVDATTQYTFGDYDVFDVLVAAGGEVLPYNPITEWASLRWSIDLYANQRLHEKMLIVDGTHATIGGRNWGDDYLLSERWRDTDVYLAGPVVAEMQQLFLGLWTQFGTWEEMAGCPQQQAYGFYCPDPSRPALADDPSYFPTSAMPGDARGRIIYNDPRAQASPHGYISTVAMVRAARSSIKITNSYFVPPRRLRKHLKAAARRGVEVVVVTNSLESTDAYYMYYASLNYYEELISAGVEIRQYRGTETMHAKSMIIDDAVAVVGSYNLDPRSAASNSEAFVVIRGAAHIAESVTQFAIDKAYTDVADYDFSLADWLKAKAFRIVEPLL